MKWAGVLWKRGLLFHFSSDSMDTMGPVVVMIGDDDDGDHDDDVDGDDDDVDDGDDDGDDDDDGCP